MSDTGRHRRYGFMIPLLAGLLASQLIATAVVYRSNRQLESKVTALQSAGYLAVPGPNTHPGLTQIRAAAGGGLFFTLSTGAALVLVSIPAVRLGRRLSRIHRRLPLVLLLIPAGGLWWINSDGFNWIGTLFIALVPVCVMLFWPPVRTNAAGPAGSSRWLIPAAALLILAGGWLTQLNDKLFINIRDFVLLANPVGIEINDFYYRYTLFPAEVFKSLAQKTLRTYYAAAGDPIRSSQLLSTRLKSLDYLPVPAKGAADVVVRTAGDRLAFLQHGRIVWQTDTAKLLNQPRLVLDSLSINADRYRSFRLLTFAGILLAFPTVLFLLLYGGLLKVMDAFAPPRSAAAAAALICLGLGLWPLFAVHHADGGSVDRADVSSLLSSENRQERTVALRFIDAQGLEIGHYPGYKALLDSDFLPERYWLARALGASRIPSTFADLLLLLQDPHTNVVCQAFYGLGRRGDPRAIPIVRARIETLDNWYSQRYGYNALKTLGWVQPESITD